MSEYNKLEIHRVMHDIKRRRLQVLRVVDITPRMRRITLGGEQLAGFISLGSDDHIKLLFPQNAAELAALQSPTFTIKGEGPQPAMRDYTPRRFDLALRESGRKAIAQCYSHMIMPLASAEDKKTQTIWGIKDYEYRFKRRPKGMWLPETAVNTAALEILSENGMSFTILA